MARKTNYTKTVNGKDYDYYRKYATINGKREMIYGNSKSDWERKVEEKKRLANLGVTNADATFCKTIDFWMYNIAAKRHDIKPNTFAAYEGRYRLNIKGCHLAGFKLHEITAFTMQEYVNKLVDEGRSRGYIDKQLEVFNMFFKYATAEGCMFRNPLVNLSLPKPKGRDEIEVFSKMEIDRLIPSLKGERLGFLFYLSLASGVRIGEALATSHDDMVDPFHVYKQQSYIRPIKGVKDREKGYLDIVSPKTKGSDRFIPLSPKVFDWYEEHKKICQIEKLARGKGKIAGSDQLFLHESGKRMHNAYIADEWKRMLNKADIPYRKIHTLRHTYITKLVQSGTPLATVMKLSGHVKYDTILRYTHVETDFVREATQAIDELL
jgi:Site-specific recombinase XerD